MTMPVMEPDFDAEVLRDWARAIDDGPFSSLCWGERMAFDNPETLTLMGALAAWTDRVPREAAAARVSAEVLADLGAVMAAIVVRHAG